MGKSLHAIGDRGGLVLHASAVRPTSRECQDSGVGSASVSPQEMAPPDAQACLERHGHVLTLGGFVSDVSVC